MDLEEGVPPGRHQQKGFPPMLCSQVSTGNKVLQAQDLQEQDLQDKGLQVQELQQERDLRVQDLQELIPRVLQAFPDKGLLMIIVDDNNMSGLSTWTAARSSLNICE